MNNKQEQLRGIPQVEKLLQSEELLPFAESIGRGTLTRIIRDVLASFRQKISDDAEISIDDIVPAIILSCKQKVSEKLHRVINCSGIIIHTNLGRAPIAKEILEKINSEMQGYCNLEFHIPSRKRGRRGGFAEELICDLTGAEDALIVNNNASAVFLILNEFALNHEVIVSRGELVQIGGGFRIPDIMSRAGAKLIEVGTTNITTADDYKNAISANTAMIFSVHQSNYRITGFTKAPDQKELAALKNDDILFVRDLGSGNFVNDDRLTFQFEPLVSEELRHGADLLCFSGDKLLGACQAGIIVGKKEYIARLKRNPLMRMLRVDKFAYFILQESFILYENGLYESLPLWHIVLQDRDALVKKRSRILRRVNAAAREGYLSSIDTKAVFGGGAMPVGALPSVGIGISIPGMSAGTVYNYFVNRPVPILGSVSDDMYILNLMTVFEADIPLIVDAINSLTENAGQ